MDNAPVQNTPIPPDCFRHEEVELFQSLGERLLASVHYYPWLNLGENAAAAPYRFLMALELVFASGESLLLSSGEDSEAIAVISEAQLMATAEKLQQLHGLPTIQRLMRNEYGVWQHLVGKILQSIQLSRHQNGLYRNDALMLDFGQAGVVIELQDEGEGLLVRAV